jgi:Fe-S-cluster-containing hydrogenase component 2
MERVLVIDRTKCSGCRICEAMCSLSHEQECNPEKSRIRIITSEEEGSVIDVPTDAIYLHPATGARSTNPDKCIGCAACVYACPFGATYVDRARGLALRCDLCDGDPLCAKFCPTGCLQFLPPDEVSVRLRRAHIEAFLKYQGMPAPAEET